MSDMTDEEYLTGEDTVFNVSEPDRPSGYRKEGEVFNQTTKSAFFALCLFPDYF